MERLKGNAMATLAYVPPVQTQHLGETASSSTSPGAVSSTCPAAFRHISPNSVAQGNYLIADYEINVREESPQDSGRSRKLPTTYEALAPKHVLTPRSALVQSVVTSGVGAGSGVAGRITPRSSTPPVIYQRYCVQRHLAGDPQSTRVPLGGRNPTLSPPGSPVPVSKRFQPAPITTTTGLTTTRIAPFVTATALPSPAPSPAPWTSPRTSPRRVSPPRSPRSMVSRAAPVQPSISVRSTQTGRLTPVVMSPPQPLSRLAPVRMTSVPVSATAKASVPADPSDVGAVAVCTAYADGYHQNHQIVTQIPLIAPNSHSQTVGCAGTGQFGTPGLVARDIAGLHWEREMASANTDIAWDLHSDYLRPKANGNDEASAIDNVSIISGRSVLTQIRSPSTRTAPNVDSPGPSPRTNERFSALESRCLALEADLQGKDNELRELKEVAARTRKEFERKEREIQELNLRNSALSQKVSECESEVLVVTKRATELELEVLRRDDRESLFRRIDFARDNAEVSTGLNDFSSQVRQVNNARRVGEVPVVEANLISSSFPSDFPTLAALRKQYDGVDRLKDRLQEHKMAQAERGSASTGDSRSPPRTERASSAASPNSQNLRSIRGEHSITRRRKSDGAAWR